MQQTGAAVEKGDTQIEHAGAMLRMALGRQVLPRLLHPHSLAHHRPVPRTLRLHQQGLPLPSQVRRAQRVIPEEPIMPIQQVQRR